MRNYLEPRYIDTRKSFYRKAYYEIEGAWGQMITLYSYDTPVVRLGYINDEDAGYCDEFVALFFDEWDYSATTLRHVKEFLAQFGFGHYHNKRDIIADSETYCDCMILVRP